MKTQGMGMLIVTAWMLAGCAQSNNTVQSPDLQTLQPTQQQIEQSKLEKALST